ncbi:unnamed protein product [Peronospora farinosa]|uniref:AMP-dependent synthetase/ligase domain-containing protein n=1 Tax=Peronospora farinosa TaxID=134698 RepID=A0AAV0TY41_9STRA|nr:unnamed protein product [Peronospora farinosa]
MALCHALEKLRTEDAQSDDVALIQRNDQDKVDVSYRQVYQWQQELREVLCLDGGADEGVVAINLMPFSIEETATMLLMAEQRHWTYVPVDIQLPIARQLSLLQSAGVRRLVTTVRSELVKALVVDEDPKVATIKSWTLDSTMSPFQSVQVVALPSNYFQAEGNWKWQRKLRVGQDFVAPLYVLFTSGTTGKARGVLGTRQGAWTRLEWMSKTYSFITYDAGRTTRERVLRATRLSFVDSVWEILGAFLQRVPLVHLQSPRNQAEGNSHSYMKSVVLDNSSRFLEVIRSEKVTRFTTVPSVLEVLLLQTTEIDRQSCLAGLRYVLSSGEALSLHVLQQLMASLLDVTVLNLYGSTEVSGDITCMELKAPFSTVQMVEWQEYGIPIASLDRCGVIGGDETSLVLLPEGVEKTVLPSSDGLPTAVWPMKNSRESKVSTEVDEQKITGVLYVSGPLLTYGYFDNDHEDVFADSHSLLSGLNENNDKITVPSSRWFCSGDTCSVIRGHLYFCGRMDNAVKIHGQRVYMEVVERAVASALKETMRDTRFDHQGQVYAFAITKDATKHAFLQTCIVACIVCNDDLSNPAIARYFPTKAFDAWIAESFGTSHIPHKVFMMSTKAVPRLAHGKIDRQALKRLIEHFIDDCNVSLPRPRINKVKSTSEKLVARFLNEFLEIPLLDDVFDDIHPRTFREVGGNSLLAALFVHELRQECNELSLTAQDLLGMEIKDILSACTGSFRTQDHICETMKEESSLPLRKRSCNYSSVNECASGTAGELKRQKKRHHAYSGDNVGNGRGSTHQSRLTVVSRYNHSSASVDGLYLPTCYTQPSSSVKETVPASSLCMPWELRRTCQVDLGKCIDASPIVVQHRDHKGAVCSTWAIIGSHSAQVVCVDVVAAGQAIWRVTLDDRIEACAAISVKHEIVYVGTYAGSLFALSLQSGVTHWRFHAKGIIKASALVMDNQQLVVCGAYDNTLYGLDTLTGQQRWAFDVDGSIFATPLYCAWSGQLFSATTNGNVVALRSSSNFDCVEEQWKMQLQAPVFAGLNADSTCKMLIIGCADGQLYGVSMSTGSIQWQVTTDKPIFSSPCVYRPGSIVFGSHDGMLRKVDCQNGKLAWTTNLHSAIFASPTVVRLQFASRSMNQSETNDDGRLLCCVTTTAGGLYFCDETTGSIVYQTNESSGEEDTHDTTSKQCSTKLGPLFGSPVLVDNWCLLGTRTNHFYIFELVCTNSATKSGSSR